MSEDLRVLKTKKAIKEAFISLVEEKGYSHVLIKLDTTITVHSYISIEYIISGVFGVIERWITKDFASVDDISKTLSKICIASYVTTRRKNK